MFSGLRWRSVGPDRGGRSIAVAGSAARPLEYYFGATGGGLWKTTDGGTTWSPAADKFLESSSVGAVAVAESNPDVVYVGMGEVQLRGNIIQGDGVYRTADGGKTWTHAGLADSRAIARIRVHPKNPDVVYAAVLGDPYAATDARGVYRSRDGGKAWERVLFRDAKTGAVDLSMDPNDPGHALRRTVGGVSHAALPLERRARQRPVQVDRRRDHVDRADEEPRASRRAVGQGRRLGVARGREAGLRDCRKRARRRVRVRRWRRDVEAGERRPAPAAARLLLHAHLRRHEGARHGLRVEHRVLQVHRWREDLPHLPGAARRQPRPLDRAERPEADDQRQRRRGQRVGQRSRELDGPGLSDGAVLQRLRHRAPAVPRVRRAAGQQHRLRVERRRPRALRPSGAARAATSRRIRGTRTSSMRGATAGT